LAQGGNNRCDVDGVQAIVKVDDLRPTNLPTDPPNRQGVWQWVWEAQSFDPVPNSNRHVVCVTRVWPLVNVAGDPAHLVAMSPVPGRQRGRHTLRPAHVLGVVIVDEQDTHAVRALRR
jgi:hypothetical protein